MALSAATRARDRVKNRAKQLGEALQGDRQVLRSKNGTHMQNAIKKRERTRCATEFVTKYPDYCGYEAEREQKNHDKVRNCIVQMHGPRRL